MSTSTAAIPGNTPSPRRSVSDAGVSPKEQALRAAAVAGANGHNAMEGFFGSPVLTDLQTRYVAGEIEIEDAVQALKQSYGLA